MMLGLNSRVIASRLHTMREPAATIQSAVHTASIALALGPLGARKIHCEAAIPCIDCNTVVLNCNYIGEKAHCAPRPLLRANRKVAARRFARKVGRAKMFRIDAIN